MREIRQIRMFMVFVGVFISFSTSFASAEVLDKSEHWKNFVALWLGAGNHRGCKGQRGGCECGHHLF